MNKRALIACMSVIVILGVTGTVRGADEPDSPSNIIAVADSTADDDLLLFFDENELVTATKRTTSLRRAPAIASVITADEIRKMGAINLMDVLKTLPSIGVSMDEFGHSLVEVRGVRTLTSEKILLMMDGHKLNEAWTGSAIANVYNDLPLENIKQIELIKGPGSALYGSNAFVAVINIVTKDADDTDGLELKASGGSYGTGKATITGGKVLDNFSVAGSGDYTSSDGPRLRVARDSLSSSPVLRSAAPGDTNQRLERGDFFLKGSYGDLSLMGQYVSKNRGANIGLNFALTNLDNLSYENYWAEMAYKYQLFDGLALKVRGYFDQFVLDSKLGFLPAGNPGFPDGMYVTTQLVDRNIGTELQLDYDVFKGNHAILGFQYENTSQFDVRILANFNPLTNAPRPYGDVSSIANFNKDTHRNVFAVYFQDEWDLAQSLHLTMGTRYDNYSDFGGTVNPRIGLVWEVNEQAELKLLYGRAFRAPNFKELYDQNNSVSIGNPQLKPEKTETYEASVGYTFNNIAKLNVAYFFSNIKDLIDRDTTVTPTRYINKGHAEIHGLESSCSIALPSKTRVRLGYLHQEARDPHNNRPLPWIPNDRLTASLTQEMGRHLSVRSDLLWTGSRSRPAGDPRPQSSPYTTVDLTLVARDLIPNLEITGTVRNLFNESYSDPDTSGTLQKISGDLPREGISGYVSATYRF